MGNWRGGGKEDRQAEPLDHDAPEWTGYSRGMKKEWERNREREREKKKEEERNKRVKTVFPRSQIFKSEPWAEISKTRWWVLVWNGVSWERGTVARWKQTLERERERAKKETKGGMGWKGGRKMERKVELVVRAWRVFLYRVKPKDVALRLLPGSSSLRGRRRRKKDGEDEGEEREERGGRKIQGKRGS